MPQTLLRITFTKLLLLFTGIILFLPALIFIVGYVKPLYSSLFCVAVAGSIAYQISRKSKELVALLGTISSKPFWKSNYKICLISACSVTFWMLVSGASGVGYQHIDYENHYTILHHLIYDEWPIIFSAKELAPAFQLEADTPLVYYVGHFMPAALVGKCFGWKAANLALFGWTWLELWLMFTLAVQYVIPNHRIAGSTIAVFLGLLMLISGGGFLFIYLQNLLRGVQNESWHGAMIWSLPLLFTPHVRCLLWVPQHALSAWLLLLFTMHQLRLFWGMRWWGVPIVSTFICTPFAVVGLLPYLLFLLAKSIQHKQFFKLLSFPNIVLGGVVLLFILTFVGSNNFTFPVLFLVKEWGWSHFLQKDALFLVVELGAIITTLFFCRKTPFVVSHFSLIAIAFLSLTVTTFFQIGVWNDWCARASIPSILLLGVIVAQAVAFDIPSFRPRQLLCGALLIAFGLTPICTDLRESFIHYNWSWPVARPFSAYGRSNVTEQRLGNADSFFFRHLSKKNTTASD
jgi:hypothetical protein